jgi:hypothetical protein
MEQLKTMSLVLDSDEVDTQWLFLVSHLLGAAKGLQELDIRGSGDGVLKFWGLVIPHEHYSDQSKNN